MRAFLLLLLLTLLPLQFSAATVVECYGHVAELQAQHRPSADVSAVTGMDELAADGMGFDLDCGICHANCVAAVMVTAALTVDPAGINRVEHFADGLLPPWHKRPYRPQWSTAKGLGLNAFV